MTDFQGRFVWYELMTTDPAAAQAFYGSVVGWGAQDSGMSGVAYTLFTVGGKGACGLMALPEAARQAGAPPHWLGYVAVADVDGTAARIRAAGCTEYVAPSDIPEVGRFSVFADPQGASLALFHAARDCDDPIPDQSETGRVGWHELHARSVEEALSFYAPLFGWRKTDAMDMGDMGTYQMFGVGDKTLGGMFPKPPTMPRAFWLYYFNVPDIDAAIARVTAGGGRVLMAPMEVPGGGWVVQATDPQGAAFALHGPRKA
jgi:predicted enzyme related to lactoylglutathione lyase